MNLEEAKESLYDITAMFFRGAAILWTEQINTKPAPPCVTLKMGALQRNAFPLVNEDGSRYYSCRTTAEINLYTRGKPVTGGDGVTGNYINTATSDLMEFLNFVESETITDIMAGKGMEVTLIPPVRDLTALQNDSRYRYRAMAEAAVTFAQEADGPYGVGGMPDIPNYSGGGEEGMAAEETAGIEEISTEEIRIEEISTEEVNTEEVSTEEMEINGITEGGISGG